MDDKPTPDEPKKNLHKLDLTQLAGFSFGTEWSKDKQQDESGPSRRHDDRPRRSGGGRDDRKDRRGFKRSSGPVAGGGQRDRRGGGGGERPPRDQSEGRGRRPGGPRGDRRGGGQAGPQGPYISPHFNVTFYPEDVSFAALAKTIRASARTFELFDIAKTVIGKKDRFVVVVERKSAGKPAEGETKKPFYVCLLDGMPFESEEALMNHVVQNHIERFFIVSQEEAEPPKGSFQVINKCGVTGELLGPPNYHLYNQIVQQHHAARLPRMDFERFSSRIESVRDEEVVQQWLESMKTVTRYTWRGDDVVPVDPEATAKPAVEEQPAEAEATETVEVPETAEVTEATPDSADGPEATEEASPEVTVEDSAVEAETPAEETPVPAPVTTGPVYDSLTDAKVHIIAHAREKVVRTFEHSRFHGRILDSMPDSEIKRAVEGALERQNRFPLDTANALRGRLRREGFTIFKKGSKGISYVSAVKRKFRGPGQTFADSINELINFIEHHPMVKVSELPEQFLGIDTPKSESTEECTPSATAPGTVSPFGEADQPRIKRMQVDLRWLVTEGYVTEFIDGSLFAAPPMPAPKPKEVKADTPAPAKVETQPEASDAAESVETPDAAAVAPAPSPEAEKATEAVAVEAGEVATPMPEPAGEPVPDAPVAASAETVTPAPKTEAPEPTAEESIEEAEGPKDETPATVTTPAATDEAAPEAASEAAPAETSETDTPTETSTTESSPEDEEPKKSE